MENSTLAQKILDLKFEDYFKTIKEKALFYANYSRGSIHFDDFEKQIMAIKNKHKEACKAELEPLIIEMLEKYKQEIKANLLAPIAKAIVEGEKGIIKDILDKFD